MSYSPPSSADPAGKPESGPRTAADATGLDTQVENLLQRMTLEEKIGQLTQYSEGQPTGPERRVIDCEAMIARGQIGSLLNMADVRKINHFQRIARQQSRLQIPLLFALDITHGFRTVFPIPLALAATWDPQLVSRTARVAATEASAQGVRWTFSPMIDITRDPRWGRVAEGFGEDPCLVSAMAIAYVNGYQGEQLNAPDSLAACAKHFVGYGAVEAGRDYNATEISEHSLRAVYLPPFKACVEAGVATLMSAFNTLNGVPASAHPYTLQHILRKEWSFAGPVVSDWSSIRELVDHGVALDTATAARKAWLAGIDIDMASGLYQDHLQSAIEAGQIDEAGIDNAVRRVLRLKFALGLFEQPYADENTAADALYHPDSIRLAQVAAERAIVLLKNTSDAHTRPLLPIADTVRHIALIGPLGDDPAFPQGPPADLPPRVLLATALAERLGTGGRLTRHQGVSLQDPTDADIPGAVAVARQAELVILALGEAPEMSGEAASRAYLDLPGKQQELLEAIVATGKPVVLILFGGRPLTLPWAFAQVQAVLAAWYPGIASGPALTRILFGDVEPSGRLPFSWPRSVGQLPLYYNALSTGRPAGNQDLSQPPHDVNSRYLSRYIDEQNSPQFPFGHGLSYTRFRYGPVTLDRSQLSASALNATLAEGQNDNSPPVLVAEAHITNTGERTGTTVAQLYLRQQGTWVAQPVRALKGFQRIRLAPGETATVRFELSADSFAIWNETHQFAAEPARVSLWISSDCTGGDPATLDILP